MGDIFSDHGCDDPPKLRCPKCKNYYESSAFGGRKWCSNCRQEYRSKLSGTIKRLPRLLPDNNGRQDQLRVLLDVSTEVGVLKAKAEMTKGHGSLLSKQRWRKYYAALRKLEKLKKEFENE